MYRIEYHVNTNITRVINGGSGDAEDAEHSCKLTGNVPLVRAVSVNSCETASLSLPVVTSSPVFVLLTLMFRLSAQKSDVWNLAAASGSPNGNQNRCYRPGRESETKVNHFTPKDIKKDVAATCNLGKQTLSKTGREDP